MKHKISKPDKDKNKTGYFSQGLANDRPCSVSQKTSEDDVEIFSVWDSATGESSLKDFSRQA